MNSIEEELEQELLALGLKQHIQGFEYMKTAIQSYRAGMSLRNSVMPVCAKMWGVSQKAIWRGCEKVLDESPLKGTTTPKKFIAKYAIKYSVWTQDIKK